MHRVRGLLLASSFVDSVSAFSISHGPFQLRSSHSVSDLRGAGPRWISSPLDNVIREHQRSLKAEVRWILRRSPVTQVIAAQEFPPFSTPMEMVLPQPRSLHAARGILASFHFNHHGNDAAPANDADRNNSYKYKWGIPRTLPNLRLPISGNCSNVKMSQGRCLRGREMQAD
ncbi:hypothetical protein BDZ45DRAFT_391336 [Acephala macrosclerotiorum]|nr:hypothetical protein BDZ45DRAFT_391336 [Acephala macrosclerotiorum]